jgi:hypothetical protein
MENVLGMIRERRWFQTLKCNILLLASDTLRNLLNNVSASNEMPLKGILMPLWPTAGTTADKRRKKKRKILSSTLIMGGWY